MFSRLVFSDWLINSDDSTTQNGSDSNTSEKQDVDFLHNDFRYDEGSSSSIENFFDGEIGECLENCMIDSPFTFLDQSNVGNCFMALSAGNSAYNGF